MPFIQIWIHLIWSTKNRQPYLTTAVRSQIIAHIRENARHKGIHLDFINGHLEHLHTLISLKSDQSIAKVAQLLKGESSYWVNQKQLINTEFNWQEEYIALSVSHSAVDKVREYIKNQQQHHQKRTFAEEYKLFLKKNGFEI
ncbi:MAG: IS200/IS605 family transposase [bacterium]|nr:IS200/IS605 family transposase [bacterium]